MYKKVNIKWEKLKSESCLHGSLQLFISFGIKEKSQEINKFQYDLTIQINIFSKPTWEILSTTMKPTIPNTIITTVTSYQKTTRKTRGRNKDKTKS